MTNGKFSVPGFDIHLFERDPDILACLKEMLESLGARVFVVSSYHELAPALQQGEISALVCELWDEKSSRDFLRSLEKTHRGPRKIVLTSIFSDSSLWPGMEHLSGDWVFMPKPFSALRLMSFLDGRNSMSDQLAL